MGLFTDSYDWLTEEDLKTLDREIGNVAATEEIPLSGVNGAIQQGISNAGLEIMSEALQSFQSVFAPAGTPWNHYLALMNTGSGSPYGNTQRIQLGQIVVEQALFGAWSAVKNFAAYHALLNFYQSAMTRKEPDRYSDKYQRFESRMNLTIRPLLFSNGLPCVANPLARPAAVGDPLTGKWSAANVTDIAGGANASTQAIDVAVTYTGSTWKDDNGDSNAESAPSDRVRFTIPANRLLKVSIASLNPPTGQSKRTTYLGTNTPMVATGWLIYVGTRGNTLYRQTATPIPIVTKTYEFAADPVASGVMAGTGQYPDLAYSINKTMARG